MRHETVLKIIGLFRSELGKGLTILEVAKKLRIGYRPAYNHITALGKAGILRIAVVGRAKQCSLNLSNAAGRHLLQEVDLLRKERLFKANPKLRAVLEGLVMKITDARIADVHTIVIFGSYAEGTATKTSDIDILFLISDLRDNEVRQMIERECASYQYSHHLTISPVITDIGAFATMLRAKGLNVGKEVKAFGIPLYGFEQFWRLLAWQETAS